MPKFLRAVRLDNSDAELFPVYGAAEAGAWVVSGGFAVCDLASGPACQPSCHCESSFLALGSKARCTIAEVVEVDEATLEQHADLLAWHLLKVWGAPDLERARAAAEDEIRYTSDLAEPFADGLWLTVRRTPNADGSGIDEQYNVYDRLLIGAHRL